MANQSTTVWQTFSDMPETVYLPIHYTSFNYNPDAAVTASPTSSPTPAKKSHAGAIAGGVVGGLAGLALIGALIFFLLRHYRKSKTPVYQPETTYTEFVILIFSSPSILANTLQAIKRKGSPKLRSKFLLCQLRSWWHHPCVSTS
jgi:H+/Cl- antiporter ClcA